jgi:hypothetical protein
MQSTRRRWLPLLVVVVLLPMASPASADPFSNLADTITAAGAKWAPALMVLGALTAGGAIVMGSHESGRWAKNFLLGGIFLILAGLGAAILAKVQSLIGGF